MKSKMTSSLIKFLTIFFLSVAILAGTLLILRPKMKTLDIHHSMANEYTSFKVDFDPVGIAEVEDAYQEDGVVHVILRPVQEGETSVIVYCNHNYAEAGADSFNDFAVVDRFGMMHTATYDFNGVQFFILAMGLVFLFSAVALFFWHHRSRKAAFFSYKRILDFGLGIFFLIQALVLIAAAILAFMRPDLQIHGEHFFRLTTLSMSYLSILSFPVLFIFCLLISLSNLSLMKKEGRRFSNTLGILLSILLMLGIIACAVMLYTFPMTLDLNAKDITLILIRGIVSTLFFYFECNLFSTLLHCQLAGRHTPAYDKDYLIILGCGIREDGTLYPLLKGRADRAIAFYKAQLEATGKKAFFVPSGGQGDDECMPEGEAIRNYLASQGIPEEQILPETRSVNTLQNMQFSKAVIEENVGSTELSNNIAFSTTNYHVYRAGILASDAGMNADGMGAKTKWYFWPNALIREFIGMLAREWKLHLAIIIVITLQAVFTGNIQWLFQIF